MEKVAGILPSSLPYISALLLANFVFQCHEASNYLGKYC